MKNLHTNEFPKLEFDYCPFDERLAFEAEA